MFEQRMHAGWGDMDFNAHMANTAYLDKAADTRMLYFAAHGFPVSEFARLRVGPVIFRDEIDYFREVMLLDELVVTLQLAGLNEEAGRFRLRNEFRRSDGAIAARVTSTGGWLDLDARKLVRPPAALLATLQGLARSADFAAM